MKGVKKMEDSKIIIELTKAEYDYISLLCNTMYDNLKKLPKNMRTPKFYLLENMIASHFTK